MTLFLFPILSNEHRQLRTKCVCHLLNMSWTYNSVLYVSTNLSFHGKAGGHTVPKWSESVIIKITLRKFPQQKNNVPRKSSSVWSTYVDSVGKSAVSRCVAHFIKGNSRDFEWFVGPQIKPRNAVLVLVLVQYCTVSFAVHTRCSIYQFSFFDLTTMAPLPVRLNRSFWVNLIVFGGSSQTTRTSKSELFSRKRRTIKILLDIIPLTW